jgi:hypothetical protein
MKNFVLFVFSIFLSFSLFGEKHTKLCKDECGLLLEDEDTVEKLNSKNNQLKVICKKNDNFFNVSFDILVGQEKNTIIDFNNDIHTCNKGCILNGRYSYSFDLVDPVSSNKCSCYKTGLLVTSYRMDKNNVNIPSSKVSRMYCLEPFKYIVKKQDIKNIDCKSAADKAYSQGKDPWREALLCWSEKTFYADKIKEGINSELFDKARFKFANQTCYLYNNEKFQKDSAKSARAVKRKLLPKSVRDASSNVGKTE